MMKHDPKLTDKRRLLKKAWLFLVAATVLLFSACSQQPTMDQGVESQGLGSWSFLPSIDYPAYIQSVTTDNNNYPIVAYYHSGDSTKVKRWSGNSLELVYFNGHLKFT
jgi:hypothetical protein